GRRVGRPSVARPAREPPYAGAPGTRPVPRARGEDHRRRRAGDLRWPGAGNPVRGRPARDAAPTRLWLDGEAYHASRRQAVGSRLDRRRGVGDMTFTNPQFLVETEWLEAHLAAPDLRVLDCTVVYHVDADGHQLNSGREAWAQGHIPGSDLADHLLDLAD